MTTTRTRYSPTELAESMLNGRESAWLSAKQTKFLQDVLLRELQREMDDFNRRNPQPTAHQPRLTWRDRARLEVTVNGQPYVLTVNSRGSGWLGPA